MEGDRQNTSDRRNGEGGWRKEWRNEGIEKEREERREGEERRGEKRRGEERCRDGPTSSGTVSTNPQTMG